MPFAVLQFNATDALQLSRFVLSGPDDLKAYLEESLCMEIDVPEEEEQSNPDMDYYAMWNGNNCVLSKGYYLDAHELLNKIEQNGWIIDTFSTSLTGSGVQCQTYVLKKVA